MVTKKKKPKWPYISKAQERRQLERKRSKVKSRRVYRGLTYTSEALYGVRGLTRGRTSLFGLTKQEKVYKKRYGKKK